MGCKEENKPTNIEKGHTQNENLPLYLFKELVQISIECIIILNTTLFIMENKVFSFCSIQVKTEHFLSFDLLCAYCIKDTKYHSSTYIPRLSLSQKKSYLSSFCDVWGNP